MNKKLLLIEPPFYRLYKSSLVLHCLPLALGYLAGVVRQRSDWAVKVYNADFALMHDAPAPTNAYLTEEGFRLYIEALNDLSLPIWQEVAGVIRRENPSVVGISAKSQNFSAARNVARIVKQVNPKIHVVLGGPHPSLTGTEVFAEKCFDASVIGEGEETLLDLLNAYATGRDLGAVPGLIYRQDEGLAVTPRRAFIKDLDSLPFPNHKAEEILLNHASFPLEAFCYVFATRGCPFNCQYCGSRYIWSRSPRMRSPENVVAELRELKELGVKRIHFHDDTFGINKKYLLSLCQAIEESGINIEFNCEIHVKLVDDEVVAAMARAGCKMIMLGVESGNDGILKSIRKGVTVAQAEEAARIIKSHGVKLFTFFMVGFIEETLETMRQTFDLMRRIGSDHLVYSIFTPYPGSEAYEDCKRLGLIGPDFDVSVYNHQSPANCFSRHINKDDFRALAKEIETFVDAHNASHG